MTTGINWSLLGGGSPSAIIAAGAGGSNIMLQHRESHHMACLAISDDLRRILCVTRQGNAYGLQVKID